MKIANWDKYYENAQSRKVHRLAWVPVPNKHDGERYSELMIRKDSAEIFAAWILMLQVGSRSQCRGSLIRDDGRPHTAESLAIKTRGSVEWFKKAIPYLLQIGWLEQVPEDKSTSLPLDSQSDTTVLPPQQARREGKGTEGREGKETSDKRKLTDLWCEEWKKFHGAIYNFRGAQDGKAADNLLRIEPDLSVIMDIARKGWALNGKHEFERGHAVQLSSFSSQFDRIRLAVGMLNSHAKKYPSTEEYEALEGGLK